MYRDDFDIPPELELLPGKTPLEKIYALYAPFDEIDIAIGVYKIFLDENDNVIDIVYVYANKALGDLIHRDLEHIIGYSYLDTVKGATSKWFYYGYQAGCLNRTIQENVYSPGLKCFLEFTAKRAFAPQYCIFLYTNAGKISTVATQIRSA